MRRILLLPIVVLALVLAVHAGAEPVRIWTENQEFVFPAGAEARIPVHVANSAGAEVQGLLRSTLTDIVDGNRSGQRTESRTYAFAPGETVIGVPAGTSPAPMTRLVRISFDYTLGSATTLDLGELTVRFVDTDAPSSSPPAGGPVEAVPVDSRTPSATGNTVLPGSPDASVAAQMTQDIRSLEQDLEASRESKERDQETFRRNLAEDPSFVAMNGTLTSGGYSPGPANLTSGQGTEGPFIATYRGAGGTVELRGVMDRGVVVSLEARSSASLPAPPELAGDERYIGAMTGLAGEGFNPAGSMMNITGNGMTYRSDFSGKDGAGATLTAKIRNGIVQSVAVDKGSGLVDLPSFIALVALLAVLAVVIVVHGRGRKAKEAKKEQSASSPADTVDYRGEAKKLVRDASDLAKGGDIPAAYRQAGHALRYLVSSRYGDGSELSDTDTIDLLASIQHPELLRVSQILLRCQGVGFARVEASSPGFEHLSGELADLIDRI